MADALATLASMFQLAPHGDLPYIEFRSRGKPTHCCVIEEERDGKSWYFDIKQYVENKEYPPGISEKKNVKEIGYWFLCEWYHPVQTKPRHDPPMMHRRQRGELHD